jgi:hypothetical protein
VTKGTPCRDVLAGHVRGTAAEAVGQRMVDPASAWRQTSSAPVSSRSDSCQSTAGAAWAPNMDVFSTGGGGVPITDLTPARLGSARPDPPPLLPALVLPAGQPADVSLRAARLPSEWRPAESVTPTSLPRESLLSRSVALSSDCGTAARPCLPQSGFIRSGFVKSGSVQS